MQLIRIGMKTKLILMLLVWGVSVASAQNTESDNTPKTLINGTGDLELSAFVGAEASATSLADETALLTGFNAGLLINNRLSLGGFYAFSVNEVVPNQNLPLDTYLDLRMGGGMVEYRFFPNSLIHLSLPLLIGGGEVQLDRSGDYDELDPSFGEKNFFLVEPGLLGELNITKAIKFQLGVSYRALMMDGDYFGFNQTDFSGLNGKAGIRIHLFN